MDQIVVDAINKLLNAIKPGAKLPEGVTPENFPMVLDMAVSFLTGDTATEDAPEEDPADNADGPPMPPEGGVSMGARLKAQEKKIAELGAQLSVLAGNKAKAAEDNFSAALASLIENGVPASSRDALIRLGRANEWDTACLAGFNTKGVALGAKLAPAKASASPPNPEAKFEDDLRKQLATAGYTAKEIETALAKV